MIKTYSTSLHRRFLSSHVVLYCMKSSGTTDTRPEGRIVHLTSEMQKLSSHLA